MQQIASIPRSYPFYYSTKNEQNSVKKFISSLNEIKLEKRTWFSVYCCFNLGFPYGFINTTLEGT